MGCGQSKIGNIYPKNKKNKNSSNKKNGDSIRNASIEHKNGNGNNKGNRTNNNSAEVNRNEDQNGTVEIKSQNKKKSNAPGNGPLLQQAEISSSQLDFFKMLDEKIDNGPDYDEKSDKASRAERVSKLLRRWELASVSELGNNSSNGIKNRQTTTTLSSSRQSLSAKDREGMRNIVGGRPECAPIFTRNANRVDGLQESYCPSPKMPRHVLESITQSPTQSLKNVTLTGVSPPAIRYQDNYKDCDVNQTSKSMSYTVQNHSINNGEYAVDTQKTIYREQYLQQTGMLQSQYSNPTSPGRNFIRNNSAYIQPFQLANPQSYQAPRKRGFNAAQIT